MQHIAKYILIYIRHFCSICLLTTDLLYYIIVTQWQNGFQTLLPTYLKIIHIVRKLLKTTRPSFDLPFFAYPKIGCRVPVPSYLSTTLQYLSRHRCMGDYCILLCKFDTTASAILYYKSFNFLCFGMEIGKMKKV